MVNITFFHGACSKMAMFALISPWKKWQRMALAASETTPRHRSSSFRSWRASKWRFQKNHGISIGYHQISQVFGTCCSFCICHICIYIYIYACVCVIYIYIFVIYIYIYIYTHVDVICTLYCQTHVLFNPF